MCVFSSYCFGQRVNNAQFTTEKGQVRSETDNISKEGLVIAGYYVEETINMAFGKTITKYEVSRLSMVNTCDLGPNNTRVVTPIYRKSKIKTVESGLQSKVLVDPVTSTIKPVKVEVVAQAERPQYITVDVVNTYAKVLDKGYKSIDMLTKVADRAYFDGDLVNAAKYYSELFSMSEKLESMYYYRYAQALKGIGQMDKADEMIKLFESKKALIK